MVSSLRSSGVNGQVASGSSGSSTLGGGLPLLAREFGYAADHVRTLDVVTADGRLRHVTRESEPDLYWALLGGGHNFGVVTGLETGLVPVARLYDAETHLRLAALKAAYDPGNTFRRNYTIEPAP